MRVGSGSLVNWFRKENENECKLRECGIATLSSFDVDISDVLNYMGQDPRYPLAEIRSQKMKPNLDTAMSFIRRAEKHLNSSHLLDFSLENDNVCGKIQASQKKNIYNAKVRFPVMYST